MKIQANRLFGAVIVLTMAASATAATWVWPPETNWPEWETPFPYQRNVNMDFAVSPAGVPGGGIPGAIYTGADDDVLMDNDFVSFAQNMEWIDTLDGQSRTGFVGLVNDSSEVLEGVAVIHLDNHDEPQLVKHMWVEMVIGMTSENIGGSPVLVAPDGFSDYPLVTDAFEMLGVEGGLLWARGSLFGSVMPNPPWEELWLTVSVPPGETIVFDQIHIATECVPEPATLSLLALSGLVMQIRRRRA